MTETEEIIRLRAHVAHIEQQLEMSEQRRTTFAEQVRCEAHSIATTCGIGRMPDAALEALALCTRAANEKHGVLMAQESDLGDVNRYDLTTLKVDADSASYSETPFEED